MSDHVQHGARRDDGVCQAHRGRVVLVQPGELLCGALLLDGRSATQHLDHLRHDLLLGELERPIRDYLRMNSRDYTWNPLVDPYGLESSIQLPSWQYLWRSKVARVSLRSTVSVILGSGSAAGALVYLAVRLADRKQVLSAHQEVDRLGRDEEVSLRSAVGTTRGSEASDRSALLIPACARTWKGCLTPSASRSSD